MKGGPALILTKDQLSMGGIDNYCITTLLREYVLQNRIHIKC